LCREIIDSAAKAGVKVLVDPAVGKDFSKYAGATVLVVNRLETSAVSGSEVKGIEDVAAAAKLLRRRLNLQAVVVTLDKEGAYIETDGISEIIPTRPRSVYDVTGAGDMVCATLATALAAGCDYKRPLIWQI